MAERLVEVTEKVIGDLHTPGRGLIAIVPLLRVYGLGTPFQG
jgi:hypothetical protein